MRCLAVVAAMLLAAPLQAQSRRFEVHEASIPDIASALARGQVTSVQLVDAYLARITAYDRAGPQLNAIIRLNPRARAEAAQLDRERAGKRSPGPLYGVPVLVKDNFDTRDLPTTGSSIALADAQPVDDAHQVRMLRAAGAIILGKTNLHELAAGILTISSLGGQTLNPYDLRRNPGGSSGGTGAAIAASFAAIGWGSDTCGSIRIPAAHNNLFGLRPTKGLSSIDGIIPLSHSQDVGGPLARTARDLAIGLDATIGPDSADRTTLHGRGRPHFADSLREDALRGKRIGVLLPLMGTAAEDREVADIVRRALDRMKEQGAVVVDAPFPELDSLMANTSLINSEFKFDLLDYLATVPNAPVKSLGEILERGLYHRALEQTFRTRNAVMERESEATRTIHARRDSLHAAVVRLMDRWNLDALAYPPIRRKATPVGEAQPGANCQLSASTGMPALSAPAGFTNDSLPVGIELLGRRFEDAKLLAMAYAYERAAQPRRAPRSTPSLMAGAAPAARSTTVRVGPVSVSLSFDPLTDELSYRVTVTGNSTSAVVLQRDQEGKPGAIVYRLMGPQASAARGTVRLSPVERQQLLSGLWSVAVVAGTRVVRGSVRL